MRFFIDIRTGQAVESLETLSSVSEIVVKRGTSEPIELQFFRDEVPERLPEGASIRFMSKAVGLYDGDTIAFCGTFSRPVDEGGFYLGEASFNTDNGNALLGSPDETTANDEVSVELMAEISWLVPSATLPRKTPNIKITLENAVDNGTEAEPSSATPATVTTLTESGSTTAYLTLADASAGGVTVTLPNANVNTGRTMIVRRTDFEPSTLVNITSPDFSGASPSSLGYGGGPNPSGYIYVSNGVFWMAVGSIA